MDNIILIGMPGAGKSTVGVLLAKQLGYGFLDTDILIQQREEKPLHQILTEQGVDALIECEREAICSVDCHRTIIAPGGSAVYRPQTVTHMKKLGKIVYLRISLDEVKRRLPTIEKRGIAMGPDQTLQDIYNYREPLYSAYADLVVDTEGQTLEESVTAVLRALVEGR